MRCIPCDDNGIGLLNSKDQLDPKTKDPVVIKRSLLSAAYSNRTKGRELDFAAFLENMAKENGFIGPDENLEELEKRMSEEAHEIHIAHEAERKRTDEEYNKKKQQQQPISTIQPSQTSDI